MGKWWQPGNKENEEDKEKEGKKDEIELKPEDVKKQLDKLDTLETGFNSFKDESKKVNDRMAAFLDEQDAAKQAKLNEEKNKKNTQTQEELDELWITDPQAAAKREMRPLVEATVNTNAKLTLKELMESNPNKYELYSDPEFKSQVDKMVLGMPLNQRAHLQSIENCFYVVKGQNEEAIKEGKIKSRFTAASSTTGHEGEKGKGTGTVTLTDEQKKAAKVFGMTDEKYAELRKEYVHGV